MKDFIFIIGANAVGKSTLAKKLFEHYDGVYIEQNMVPEFAITSKIKDIGAFEEQVCWEDMLEQIWFFHKRKFKNIIALDFDDLRAREIPVIFKGHDFIILKLVSSNSEQIKKQMIKRHSQNKGLFNLEIVEKSNTKIKNRPLLPNELEIDITGKNEEQVFKEAISLIDNFTPQKNYPYKPPAKKYFYSWVKSNKLN